MDYALHAPRESGTAQQDLGPVLHGAVQGALSIGFIITMLGGLIADPLGLSYDSPQQWAFAGGGALIGAICGVIWKLRH